MNITNNLQNYFAKKKSEERNNMNKSTNLKKNMYKLFEYILHYCQYDNIQTKKIQIRY